MKGKHLLVLMYIVLAAVGMYGCSGGGGGSDITVTNPSATTASALNAASQVCANCHSANIDPAYVNASGVTDPGAPTIVTEYGRSAHNTENLATCGQCHNPAPGHPTPTTVTVNPDASATCRNCHTAQPLTASGSLPHVNPAINATWDGTASAQYVDQALTNNDKSGCRACHNPHDTTSRMAIFRDYATSGHGDVNGEAWIHYRWKGTDRADCQKCHTTSGFISKVTGGTGIVTFDAADNTKQTLYCIGCHTDFTYKVRQAPAMVQAYAGSYTDSTGAKKAYAGHFNYAGDQNPVIDPVTGTQTAQDTFPNVGKSNLCLNCHSARTIGDNVKALGAAINADPNKADLTKVKGFNNIGFINSHYLSGGAMVYSVGGYEFAGRDYTNKTSFEHNQIGTTLQPATGSGGPCAGCHMTPARHTFKGWTKDANDKITAITSTACNSCHSGNYEMTAAKLQEEKESYEAALQALKAALALRGFFWGSGNPYIFKAAYVAGGTNSSTTNWLSAGDTDATGAVTGQNNMGAAFNINLLLHEPGGYAHNRYYAKRLIYDSIDWLDDNTLNNSTATTLAGLDTASAGLAADYRLSAAQKTLAVAYILRNGARP